MNTHDEIFDIPAGRELDALINEKVMNKGPVDVNSPSWIDGYMSEDTFYSTDISAAWEVVKKLVPLFRFALAQVDSGRLWFSQFENIEHFGEWDAFEAEAETAPLAICRAALLTFFRE